MLSLFKKNADNKSADEMADKKKPALSIDMLGQILEQFPIGKKLHYCPEFMHEVVLDTIIIAYSFNDRLVYSQKDISIEKDGKSTLVINHNGSPQRISKLTEFSFVVPYHRENETKLDYNSRSSLGRNGPFRKGNNLTLIASGTGQGTPHLDTLVTRRADLKEGYYNNQTVVYLEVLADTLKFIDQREYQRFSTNIPVLLQTQEQGIAEGHNMVDFGDNSAQIELTENSMLYGSIREGQIITMTLNFDDLGEPFSLMGKVHPKSEGRAVIILSDILKNGKFSPIDMLDKFEIKTAILQHPATVIPEK